MWKIGCKNRSSVKVRSSVTGHLTNQRAQNFDYAATKKKENSKTSLYNKEKKNSRVTPHNTLDTFDIYILSLPARCRYSVQVLIELGINIKLKKNHFCQLIKILSVLDFYLELLTVFFFSFC